MEPRTAVCLVGHGMPPRDFPRGRLLELAQLENRPSRTKDEEDRMRHLERKVRTWPRTPENDPYWRYLTDLAADVKAAGGYAAAIAAFNEFCAPTVDEGIDALAADGPDAIVVVPAMVIRGGVHSEKDVLQAVGRARRRHPGIRIAYAWPFDHGDLVDLFRRQVDRFAKA